MVANANALLQTKHQSLDPWLIWVGTESCRPGIHEKRCVNNLGFGRQIRDNKIASSMGGLQVAKAICEESRGL